MHIQKTNVTLKMTAEFCKMAWKQCTQRWLFTGIRMKILQSKVARMSQIKVNSTTGIAQ